MAQRQITAQEVMETLARPRATYVSLADPTATIILGQTTTGRRLKVVVRTHDPEFVITVADRDDDK